MFVLGAPEELEALVGLFGKLYVSTFDCATFYCQRIQHQEVGNIFANDTPPQVWNWKNRLHIVQNRIRDLSIRHYSASEL